MSSARFRLSAAVVAAAASLMALSQVPVAVADDHRRGHDSGALVLIVSPASGKLTKERKVTDTWSPVLSWRPCQVPLSVP
ncbi:hypothetical protein ACFQ2B_38425 [Streptomyces stramineus]